MVVGNTTAPGSSSSTTGTDASTTEDDTSTTTVDGPCGNGVIDEGEECDATAPGGSPCSPICTLCGNGELDDGEQCDNPDNANCVGCSYESLCGNGTIDDAEVCDVWGLPPGQACSEECDAWTAVDWDARDKSAAVEFCPEGVECPQWVQNESTKVWGSGEYLRNAEPWNEISQWPEAVLRGRAIELPQLAPGDRITVFLEHSYALNYEFINSMSRYVDYAELHLEPISGGGEALDVPLGNEAIACDDAKGSNVIDSTCTSFDSGEYCAAPLLRAAGVLKNGSSNHAYVVPKEGLDAGDRRLRFTLRYDCFNFTNSGDTPLPEDDAWKISSVRVVVSKQGADIPGA